MKISSAVSKLTRLSYDLKTIKDDEFVGIVIGKKSDNTITLEYSLDTSEISQVKYSFGSGEKKAVNLTRALKILGEINSNPEKTYFRSPKDIIKKFVMNNGELPVGTLYQLLKINTESELTALGEEVFKFELRNRKRYSYKIDRKIDSIRRKFKNLWHAVVTDFMKKGGVPLYSLSIVSPMDTEAPIKDRWGSVVKNEARFEHVPVFASNGDEAVNYAKSLIGPLGTAEVEGIAVVSESKSKSLEIFYEKNPHKNTSSEERRIQENEKRILDLEESIKNIRRDIEFSKKKIEMIRMIDTILSSDIVSQEVA